MVPLFGDDKELPKMSTNKILLISVLIVIALAGIGAAVQLVPWLRDHRTEISLMLLMLLLVGSGFTVAVALLSTLLATPEDSEPRQWRCPECDEPVRPRVPTDLVPAGEWSHLDGTQLCPEIGRNGHRPADPISSRTIPSETA
jgi:hypothetical protein